MLQAVGALLSGQTYDVEEKQADRILGGGGLAEVTTTNKLANGVGEIFEVKGEPKVSLSAGETFANKVELEKWIKAEAKRKALSEVETVIENEVVADDLS